MSKLKDEEIDYIVEVYKEVGTIKKTQEITGFSYTAINRYVRDMSSRKKVSRDCKNKINQYDYRTGAFIKEWIKPRHAAIELNINPSLICLCLSGRLKQTHGFIFKYPR